MKLWRNVQARNDRQLSLQAVQGGWDFLPRNRIRRIRLCSTNMVDILCFKFYYVYAPHIFNFLCLSCWQEGISANLKSEPETWTKDKTTKINISLSGISWGEMNLPNPAPTLMFFFPQNSPDDAVFKGYAAGLSHPAQWVADWLLMQFPLVPAVP